MVRRCHNGVHTDKIYQSLFKYSMDIFKRF